MAATKRQVMGSDKTIGADNVSAGLAFLLAVGVFVDTYFHVTRDAPEGFLTPWHALLYSAAGSLSYWVLRQAFIERDAVYRRCVWGVGLFWCGGLADAAWHTIRGPESGFAVPISPPHTALFVGGIVMSAVPLLRGLTMPLPETMSWALALTIGTLVGVTNFPSLTLSLHRRAAAAVDTTAPSELVDGMLLASALVVTAAISVLMVAGLVLFRPRPGHLGVMLLIYTGLSAFGDGFDRAYLLIAAAVASGMAEVGCHLWSRTISVPRLVALTTATYWSCVFGLVQIFEGMDWSLEYWAGVLTICTLIAGTSAWLASAAAGGLRCSR